ncbi:Oligosaccharyltransferase subunit Ribophorin II-domain-containing protein [Apodospora peruviana]|uniref:Oligosaccharyltransferase subunit Ribophorin II-domain-containing protein n=1 Tax=Apodospora peruviana TaxID=516989 RepID=A0AAE0IQV1_9PEZI|nr:Oligosaccharyltransferase subunit Ribophorin II-domain-containing protein [Apodospora peruviana]
MRFLQSFTSALLLAAAGTAHAASAWGFDDGAVSVSKKASDGSSKAKLSQKEPLSTPVSLGSTDALKITLTAKDNGKAKRPHQAFLVLREQDSGLEAPFPLTVKENGKAVVNINQKEIPVQLLVSPKPLQASIVIGSFGSAQGLNTHVFDLETTTDPNAPPPSYEKPLRYGKRDEIYHIFRADPRSPPKIISLFFALAVTATVPALFIGWIALGANANHLTKALGSSPLSHSLFFGSIVAMEFVFFLYYTTWNLFQVLPVIGIVGVVTILSGTKALSEVQSRRLAGER